MHMQTDDLIWSTISTGFCSYKVSFNKNVICRNEHNATGLCNRSSCPLANSQYSTVVEENGMAYLMIKTVERTQTPSKLWEKKKLSGNYSKALEQIENELMYWPKIAIYRCKLRLTRIRQCILRAKKLELGVAPIATQLKRKTEKRLRSRELKAENTANIRRELEKELLARLKDGVYGENIFNKEEDSMRLLDELAEQDYGTLNRVMVNEDYCSRDGGDYFAAEESDGDERDNYGETSSSNGEDEPSIAPSPVGKSKKATTSKAEGIAARISKRKKRNKEMEYEGESSSNIERLTAETQEEK